MSPIIEHPDIRRTLLTMKALTQASRAICLVTARELDISRKANKEIERKHAAARAALLTPVAKAFSTDIGCEVASMGVHIHGGMGFNEEAGAAQYYRDAPILPIYEGTDGIQGVAVAERATQHAVAYAKDRKQGRASVAARLPLRCGHARIAHRHRRRDHYRQRDSLGADARRQLAVSGPGAERCRHPGDGGAGHRR
jgi:alkylation response protein AidB-like acyl-CoA dehydrogenase